MMKCEYPGCHKKDTQYYICWALFPGGHKSCGDVCAHHDKVIGRTNLIKHGFSLEEAIEWESANKDLTSKKSGDKVSI